MPIEKKITVLWLHFAAFLKFQGFFQYHQPDRFWRLASATAILSWSQQQTFCVRAASLRN